MSRQLSWDDVQAMPKQVSWDDVAATHEVPYGGKSLEQRQAESKAAFEANRVPWYAGLFAEAGRNAKKLGSVLMNTAPGAATGMDSPAVELLGTAVPGGAATEGLSMAEALKTGPLPTAAKAIMNKLTTPSNVMTRAMANRETAAAAPSIVDTVDVTKPLSVFRGANNATLTPRAVMQEKIAKWMDSANPSVRGNMVLGPDSYAPAEQPAPVQGPSFPPPKEPVLGPVGAVRPEAEVITPEKLSVWDQLRGNRPATLDAPAVNKWLGIRPDEVAHGANPGQRILDENLIGASREATKVNVDAALQDASEQLEAKFQAGSAKGVKIDGSAIHDELLKTQSKLRTPTDESYNRNLASILDKVIERYPDIDRLSPSRAHALKVEIGNNIDWKSTANDPINDAFKAAYRKLNADIKTNVDGIGPAQARWGDLYISSKGLKTGINKEVAGKVKTGGPGLK